MAMPGGAYGGGPDGYSGHNHAGSNGAHGNSNGGHHAHSSAGNGGGIGSTVGAHGQEEEEEEEEEMNRLKSEMDELEAECFQHLVEANEIQELLQTRAVARLETEKEVKRMKQAHEQKVKDYVEKAREINDVCCIRDNQIKELQGRAKEGDEKTKKFLRGRQQMLNEVKRKEREAILSEEEGTRRQASGSGSGGYARGGRSSSSAAPTVVANGGNDPGASDMGRRTQSSTGASFFAGETPATGREASAEAGGEGGEGELGEGGGVERGRPGRSNAQPKPFEQIRQTCVEDTLTNCFGL